MIIIHLGFCLTCTSNSLRESQSVSQSVKLKLKQTTIIYRRCCCRKPTQDLPRDDYLSKTRPTRVVANGTTRLLFAQLCAAERSSFISCHKCAAASMFDHTDTNRTSQQRQSHTSQIISVGGLGSRRKSVKPCLSRLVSSFQTDLCSGLSPMERFQPLPIFQGGGPKTYFHAFKVYPEHRFPQSPPCSFRIVQESYVQRQAPPMWKSLDENQSGQRAKRVMSACGGCCGIRCTRHFTDGKPISGARIAHDA